MGRPKVDRRNVRLSVTLEESEYSELTRLGASLDLSAAWMIRRAVSEFVARHKNKLKPAFPLRKVEASAARIRKAGGHGAR